MSHEIVVREEVAVQPSELLSAIATAVTNPAIDVAKIERLLAMHKEIVTEQRKTAFTAAMVRLQPRLPQIDKNGRIIVKGQERSRYAQIEDIDIAIRPLIGEEGFAFTFDTEAKNDGKQYLIIADLAHQMGHIERKSLLLPVDSSDFRSAIQCIASTISFGKRQLIKMHLNLVEKGEGDADLKPITEEQARDLETLITDAKADKKRFLDYMNAPTVVAILARDYQKAITALEAKKRK